MATLLTLKVGANVIPALQVKTGTGERWSTAGVPEPGLRAGQGWALPLPGATLRQWGWGGRRERPREAATRSPSPPALLSLGPRGTMAPHSLSGQSTCGVRNGCPPLPRDFHTSGPLAPQIETCSWKGSKSRLSLSLRPIIPYSWDFSSWLK